jgi:peptide/nickel transport system substrate-binding protein
VKRYVLRAVSLLLVAAMGLSFTSCRKKKKTPTYGGTAVVGITEVPECLDPHKATSVCENEILVNIFEGLYKYNEKGEFIPCLASDVTVSADARSYTFTIKEDIRFHDGSDLDPSDVVYSIKRASGLLPGQNDTPLIPELEPVCDVTSSELQVTVTLDSPDSELIALYTTAIIPEGSDDIETTMSGTGPFKFVSYTPGQELTLARNDDSRKKKQPYLDTVVFKIFPDMDTAYAALQDGTIDILPYLDNARASALDPEVFRLQGKASNSVQVFAFNNNIEPLNDKRVRQAINYAVDRDDIILRTMDGHGKELTTGMSPILVGPYNPSVNGTYAQDLVTAKALMEQAGLSRGFALTVLVPSNDQFQIDTAMILQEQLTELNIDLHVELVDPVTFVTRVFEQRDYETALVTLTSDFDPYDVVSRYASDSEDNFIGYNNSLVDLRLQMIPLTADTDDRNELYHEILSYTTNDACSCFIQDPYYICAVNKRLAGFKVFPNHVLDMSSVHLA